MLATIAMLNTLDKLTYTPRSLAGAYNDASAYDFQRSIISVYLPEYNSVAHNKDSDKPAMDAGIVPLMMNKPSEQRTMAIIDYKPCSNGMPASQSSQNCRTPSAGGSCWGFRFGNLRVYGKRIIVALGRIEGPAVFMRDITYVNTNMHSLQPARTGLDVDRVV